MDSSRRNTIHDVAALKVHQSGIRVTSKQKKRVYRDAFGNEMAADAGAKYLPSKRLKQATRPQSSSKGKEKARASNENDELEEFDLNVSDSEAEEDEMKEAEPGPSKKRKAHTPPIRKGRKKGQLQNDISLDFVTGNVDPQAQMNGEGTPLPDSDFLKLIHYAAAEWYESRGLLLNLPGKVRQEEKEKKAKAKLDANSASSVIINQNLEEVDDKVIIDSKTNGGRKPRVRGKNRPLKTGKPSHQKDMFQAFHGELLMALGIILQEDIHFHLEQKEKPVGWDDMPEVGDDYYDEDLPCSDRMEAPSGPPTEDILSDREADTDDDALDDDGTEENPTPR